MPEATTYYAIMDDDDAYGPRTVLRRRESDAGEVDEVFSHNLKWEFSSLLYSNERGDTSFRFCQIGEGEAEKVVMRLEEAAVLAGPAGCSPSV